MARTGRILLRPIACRKISDNREDFGTSRPLLDEFYITKINDVYPSREANS
jgi:hypothetical protein